MIEWIAGALGTLKGMKTLQAVVRGGEIPICNTRVMREDRELPWGMRILVHPRENGIEIISASAPTDSTE